MNFRKLAESQGLEEDEFLELVELFVETCASDLDRLQSAIARGDTQLAVQAAHSIKGASGNLGLHEIYEMAKSVEEKAREKSLEGATEAVKAMREKNDQLSESLRKLG
ncbi:MAG: Hpt domain-containing protein [Deltaproteobacteria bacterium]|nr:Hpt domain-containing protein [Deltaproteobacteria bacterium]MBW2020192.1 Hpt domain-containing protein [Deltaproteobacteria bacterium]MBW2075306.1 Hpt domain-containing protein [Deltaproteobacteria bacterium]RLB79759.1 MAG: hypothetical protein DRH17_13245 [Deltaproteobacteria bacterium]